MHGWHPLLIMMVMVSILVMVVIERVGLTCIVGIPLK